MFCRVEGGVEDRGGGEQDPAGERRAIGADGRVAGDVSGGGVLGGDLIGRVAGVGLTGAEDADGSGDSYDVNELRFSAVGRDAVVVVAGRKQGQSLALHTALIS